MSKLPTIGKVLLGTTSVTGVTLGSVALANSTSLAQNDQPQPVLNDPELLERVQKLEKQQEENKTNIDKIGSRPGSPTPLNTIKLEERINKLEDKVEENSMDIEFNQTQIDKNQAVIINIDEKTKKMEENSFRINTLINQLDKLSKKIDLYKSNLDQERKEILELTEKMKEFQNYGDIQNFVEKMREVVSKYNDLDKRLVGVEDSYNTIEQLAIKAFNDSRQAFDSVQKIKGLKTFSDP